MTSLLSVPGFLALGVGRFAQTRLAAVLVWAVFWALVGTAAQLSVFLGFEAWVVGYVASRFVWGRWRRSFARGMVALALAGVMVAPYWNLIIR